MALEHQDDRETVQAKREDRGAPDGRAPESPGDVSTGGTLKRTFKEFSAFTRASNSIYDVEEGRPIWKLKPQQIGITLVLLLMLVVVTVAVAVSGPLAKAVGKVIGV